MPDDTQDLADEALAQFLANVKIEAYGTVTNPPADDEEDS